MPAMSEPALRAIPILRIFDVAKATDPSQCRLRFGQDLAPAQGDS
jgi:hypothetical protein